VLTASQRTRVPIRSVRLFNRSPEQRSRINIQGNHTMRSMLLSGFAVNTALAAASITPASAGGVCITRGIPNGGDSDNGGNGGITITRGIPGGNGGGGGNDGVIVLGRITNSGNGVGNFRSTSSAIH
jgi:hypothetical protein